MSEGNKGTQRLRVPAVAVQASTFSPPRSMADIGGFLLNNDLAALGVVMLMDGGAGGFGFSPLGLPDNADDVPEETQPRYMGTVARLTGFDGLTWDRLRVTTLNTDAQSNVQPGTLVTAANLLALNGDGTFDRVRLANAPYLGAQQSDGAVMVAPPGNWAITHAPAAATQATITRAAGGAGTRHVATSISFSMVSNAAREFHDIRLRDGASGAGTILWSMRIGTPIGGETLITIGGLNIVGSDNTAMTLEFDAAGGAGSLEGVSLTGYDATLQS